MELVLEHLPFMNFMTANNGNADLKPEKSQNLI